MARALDPELLAEARRIQVRADRMVTDVMAGGYSSVFRGSGIEFEEVREFAEGDDLRSVDWNVTARQGRPFVKKFVEERELSVLFVLDVSASMGFGSAPPGRAGRRTAATTAALFVGCVAFAAARNNDKAGLVTFTDEVERYVPCKKGRNHVLRLIREACEPPQPRTRTGLAQALKAQNDAQSKELKELQQRMKKLEAKPGGPTKPPSKPDDAETTKGAAKKEALRLGRELLAKQAAEADAQPAQPKKLKHAKGAQDGDLATQI